MTGLEQPVVDLVLERGLGRILGLLGQQFHRPRILRVLDQAPAQSFGFKSAGSSEWMTHI